MRKQLAWKPFRFFSPSNPAGLDITFDDPVTAEKMLCDEAGFDIVEIVKEL
jgi:hypothetical protein